MLDITTANESVPDVIAKFPKCDKYQLNSNKDGGQRADIYFSSTYPVPGATTHSHDLAACLIGRAVGAPIL